MLKIAGAIMIIIAGSGIGFCFGEEVKLRIADMHALKRAILLLRGEIRYQNTNLVQAFVEVSEKCNGWLQDFFRNVAGQLEMREGETVDYVWEQQLQECEEKMHLKKKDIQQLIVLGQSLGCLDKEMQLNTLDYYLEQLDEDIRQASEKVAENTKLYRTMGVMCGILITLIIV